MKDTTAVKEKIINVTTELIEKNNGDVNAITARKIAERSGVALGTINYHFESKNNLITICVQRIIEKVIAGSNTAIKFDSDKARLTAWATYVFNFLFEHPAISKISILDDMRHYSDACNSVQTQRGFILALTSDIDVKDKPLVSFILTSAIQTAFLDGDAIKSILGYDFTKPSDRAEYIKKLVNVLFDGARKGN